MREYLLKRTDDVLQRMARARVVVLFVFHTIVFAVCYLFAELTANDLAPLALTPAFWTAMAAVVVIQLSVGAVFHFYAGWWRYVSIADALRMAGGLTTALAVTATMRPALPAFGIVSPLSGTHPGALVIDWAFCLIALVGARIAVRLMKDQLGSTAWDLPETKVLIVGAADAGEALAREITQRTLGIRVVAFVDDQRAKWNSEIRGLKVRGPIADIARIARSTGATEALIAMPAASGQNMRDIIQLLDAAHLKFRTIPGLDQLVRGTHVTKLRPVNIEDLLRRQPIALPGEALTQLVKGSRVVVTGAGGTIGGELARQILELQPESLDLVDHSEFALYEITRALEKCDGGGCRVRPRVMDVRNDRAMRHLLSEVSPRFLLHAAAYKHVPLGEQNAAEYVTNDCVAARRLAELCDDQGVERFVFISTDKAINPSSVMGASKRAAEIALLDLSRRSTMKLSIVRFGNVIGSSGSVVPLFLEQIAAGGPLTVTHPGATRYFIRTSEAVSLVLRAMALGDHGCVYMLDMGDPVRIQDLARDLIRLSHHDPEDIGIVFTGLRPGEKVAEEIQVFGEAVRPTVHPQIVVTEPPQPPSPLVAAWLEQAGRLTSAVRPAAVVALLRELVPEFRSSPDVSGGSLETGNHERREDVDGQHADHDEKAGERPCPVER
jgi:FlaA1/EpsC-like NDP-sugar epimerase